MQAKAKYAFAAKRHWKQLMMRMQKGRSDIRRLAEEEAEGERSPPRISPRIGGGATLERMRDLRALLKEETRIRTCDARDACLIEGIGPRGCGRAGHSMRDPSDNMMLTKLAEAIRVDLLRPGMTVVKRMEMDPSTFVPTCRATMGMDTEEEEGLV